MRRILSLLCDYRVERLKQHRAPQAKLTEVQDMYRWFDSLLSGVRLDASGRIEDPESALAEVMTTADFVNALGDFVQRQIVPGYEVKRFDFEQFITHRLPLDEADQGFQLATSKKSVKVVLLP